MTKIVIYDLETSGIDSAFSSILQAAAVCVDENFNEIDRFNLRGRMKKEYPIPHPKALLVNDVGVDQLKNHENKKQEELGLLALLKYRVEMKNLNRWRNTPLSTVELSHW